MAILVPKSEVRYHGDESDCITIYLAHLSRLKRGAPTESCWASSSSSGQLLAGGHTVDMAAATSEDESGERARTRKDVGLNMSTWAEMNQVSGFGGSHHRPFSVASVVSDLRRLAGLSSGFNTHDDLGGVGGANGQSITRIGCCVTPLSLSLSLLLFFYYFTELA